MMLLSITTEKVDTLNYYIVFFYNSMNYAVYRLWVIFLVNYIYL